ncbi:MAG: hypothetical protein WCO51_12030 [bacterium]
MPDEVILQRLGTQYRQVVKDSQDDLHDGYTYRPGQFFEPPNRWVEVARFRRNIKVVEVIVGTGGYYRLNTSAEWERLPIDENLPDVTDGIEEE